MVRSSVLGFVSAIALLSAANAADIYRGESAGGYKDGPVYVANTWTGFYIGAHIGYAGADLDVKDINGFAANASGGTVTSSSPDGVFGGGQLGYNWQMGQLVLGVEADLGYMDTTSNKLINGTNSSTRVGIDGGLYGDITGRIGYAFGPALLYAKGGFAFLDTEEKFSTTSPGFAVKSSLDTLTGYTIGGGVEYKFSPAWSLKGEYQYFDFGSEVFTVASGSSTFRFKEDLTLQTVKVGLNYHFNKEYEPLK